MIFHLLRTGLLAALAAALLGCSDPPVPPEVGQLLQQEQDLRRAGAVIYAPEEFRRYQDALQAGRDRLREEKDRFVWFRDYEAVALHLRQTLDQGKQVAATLGHNRQREKERTALRIEHLERRTRALRELVGRVKDRRLSRRSLVGAELRLAEARRLAGAGRNGEAQEQAAEAEADIAKVAQLIRPLLARYADAGQLARWRRLAEETITESRRSGGYAIVVRKLDRQLTLYRGGRSVCTFAAGLGFNYLTDKLHSGDLATPEGKYRVVKKVPGSRYYRALLIDYPNSEDRQRFLQAKKGRQIPAGAGIGGLIEIHGGGKDGMTNGCVALENPEMQQLFDLVAVGTPVAIVGSLEADNIIAATLPWLE